jgi:hypothetical protein
MTQAQRGTLIDSVYRIQELADYIVPFAIRIACDLRVADLLVDGPETVAVLAGKTGAHEATLRRILRTLATKHIFVEDPDGRFRLTPLAELFRGDHPLSLRDAYTMIPANFEAWAHVAETVRTGRPVFPEVHGHDYYAHLAEHPEDAARFNGIQTSGNRLELRAMLRACDWRGFETVLDVGGSTGAFLAGLLSRYKRMRGTLLDLPHVVADAPPVLAAAGVQDRCEIVAGDFFADVPAGHDCYVLKRVLYDWDDERAAALLRRVRAAARPDSVVLLLDPVVDTRPELDISKVYDLLSLVTIGGRARTVEEIAALCQDAGLRVTTVTDTTMFPLIEAVPA